MPSSLAFPALDRAIFVPIGRVENGLKKAGLDLCRPCGLAAAMATSLNRTDDRAEHDQVVSALFGLLTARLEDCATLAVEGQGAGGRRDNSELASSVSDLLEETAILNQAISTILMLAADSPGSSKVE
jgi:hypothetical protein